MKIQIASDLHLELRRGRRPEIAGEFRAVADRDLLVLAGDIGRHLNAWGFIKQELARSPVIYVPGNHEYYCWQTRERVDKAWRRKAQQNTDLHYLVAEGVTIAGVRFWGAPWYSDLFGRRAPGYLRDVEYGISDFSPMVSDFGRWTITRHLEEHARQTQLLREQSGQIDVVITHWPPTLHAIAPRFDDDPYNGCFVNDREDPGGRNRRPVLDQRSCARRLPGRSRRHARAWQSCRLSEREAGEPAVPAGSGDRGGTGHGCGRLTRSLILTALLSRSALLLRSTRS